MRHRLPSAPRSLAALALLCALIAGPACAAPPDAAADPPNIVFIYVDDMGYADLGAFGADDIPTPRLDALAASGTMLTHTYNSSAGCTTSRAAMLTGSYHPRLSILQMFAPTSPLGMHPDEVTTAELLKTRGYQAAMVGTVQLKLAGIAGIAYRLEAARRLTCAGLDQGRRLSVISAIVKAASTNAMREGSWIAVRWTLAGTHSGAARWGPPTGESVLLIGESQYRLVDGRVVEEWLVYDELAVLTQIARARERLGRGGAVSAAAGS